MKTENLVGWFEIPVSEMDRAIAFYQAVLGIELGRHTMGMLDMAWFPTGSGPGAAGSLVRHEAFYHPSEDGVLVYFTSPTGDLRNELGRVEAAGGEVLVPRKQISEDVGFMAVFRDSEGNRIALHSLK
ncbi:MAG: VOC family protein [Gemmatimonadota bacterium]